MASSPMVRAVALLFLGVAWAAGAAAQDARVEIQLLGERDQPTAGVLVQLSGPALPEALTRIADADGRAVFEDLPVGEGFLLRTTHVGYGTAEVGPFSLTAGQIERRTIRLRRQVLGTDTLTVFASPLRIRRQDTEFTARIDRGAIELLPTSHRASDLVGLAAGARPNQVWGGAALQSNVYQLDGLAQTMPGGGGAFVEPSIRWIERVELRGLGAGAEHGNFQGGLVNVVTRSGSNERTGGLRISAENRALNASNLERQEVGMETELRHEVEGEVGGPILRDRLYYFVGGHLLQERRRAQSQLPRQDFRFLPWTEDRTEFRGFGKVTWEPSFRDRFELAAGVVQRTVERANLSGYEFPEAAGTLENPTGYYRLGWDRTLGARQRIAVSVAGFHARQELKSPSGPHVPGAAVFTYGYLPVVQFRNPLYNRMQRPSSHTANLQWEMEGDLGSMEHRLLVGAELSRGRWVDHWTRNGGMSWRPLRGADPDDATTWGGVGGLHPTEWGGEVHMDARIRNQALFLQSHLTVSPRLSISPGLRFGRWAGEVLPGGRSADRFEALSDTGFDPRLGVTVDPTGGNRLVFKAHWGRYHQGMLAQFFDRAEGAEVFSDRELWYYWGTPPENGTRGFTPAERDAMLSGSPRFEFFDHFRMNEEGPVDPAYRQPYVDQWIAGIEIQPADRVRAELLYVNRENHRMVGLVDRNLADNYTVYRDVGVYQILQEELHPFELGDENLVLPELWIPNDMIRRRLVEQAEQGGVAMPPGFEMADTLWLSYEEDFVLQNLEDARRRFHQVQASVHAGYPGWGASLSLVWTRLRGNMNAVTPYEAGTDFEDFDELGAGPFVRPNEQINFDGDLPGVSELELKLALHGEVGWETRAGAFLNAARGDRFTPFHTLRNLGGIIYIPDEMGPIEPALLTGVAGQRLKVRERGSYRLPDRVTLDLRLERALPWAGGRLRGTLDLFNVWNTDTETEIFPAADAGQTAVGGIVLPPHPIETFGAVRERIPPRTLRLGLVAHF
jgi:hypothetical protein